MAILSWVFNHINLENEEEKEQIRKYFNLMDTNKDGEITEDEMLTCEFLDLISV